MARVLEMAGVAVEYDEIPKQGHWWWDTNQVLDTYL